MWPDRLHRTRPVEDQLAATPLALRPKHVVAVYTLPAVHRDSFDLGCLLKRRTRPADVKVVSATGVSAI